MIDDVTYLTDSTVNFLSAPSFAICTFPLLYVCLCVCVCVCVYAWVCVCLLYAYICIFVVIGWGCLGVFVWWWLVGGGGGWRRCVCEDVDV